MKDFLNFTVLIVSGCNILGHRSLFRIHDFRLSRSTEYR